MNKNIDLVKDAIADATAVRESAIETAKMALVESYMPKIEEWLENDSEDFNLDETKQPTKDGQKKDAYVDDGDDGTPAEGVDVSEKKKYKEEDEEDSHDKMDEDIDLNIEAIMQELDAAISESEEDLDEKYDEEDKKDEGSINLGDVFSEEEIRDIMSVLEAEEKELDEEDCNSDKNESVELGQLKAENAQLRADLAESYDAIKEMRSAINEVNLLNMKLLYTNKLMSAFEMSEGATRSMFEAFDRAATVQEAKLVFVTVATQLKEASAKKTVKSESRTTRFASDAAGIVNENIDSKSVKDQKKDTGITRLQQLAGLKKTYN